MAPLVRASWRRHPQRIRESPPAQIGTPQPPWQTAEELRIGEFKNGGWEWRPRGEPEEIRVHHSLDKNLGRAIPYGVYNVIDNQGWVNAGIDHENRANR